MSDHGGDLTRTNELKGSHVPRHQELLEICILYLEIYDYQDVRKHIFICLVFY